MTRGLRIVLALSLVAGAIGYLFVSAARSRVVYYTVSETLTQLSSLEGRRIRVAGAIDRESVDWRPGEVTLRFNLMEGGLRLPVVYRGLKPDLFDNPGVQAVVEGKLGADGTLTADRLLMQCPSRYERPPDQPPPHPPTEPQPGGGTG